MKLDKGLQRNFMKMGLRYSGKPRKKLVKIHKEINNPRKVKKS